MIQDIEPSIFHNEYINHCPEKGDAVFCFDDEGRILAAQKDGKLIFPDVSAKDFDTVYLFSIDDKKYHLLLGSFEKECEGYSYLSVRSLRENGSGAGVFAAFTAYHLWKWYSDNRYCGSCAGELVPDKTERALKCKKCGKLIYPRINPAVIVGVIKNDTILITRYKRGYSHDALIAGFAEIGETLEQTVAREVMEEAGIKVKNIRYYKSQPWGMAQDLLVGFFCEADGDDEIRMDDTELGSAAWKRRDEIELQPVPLSLTNEMMYMFKEGKV